MKLKENNNIVCTVSAGYSSALMAYKMAEWYPNHNILYVFANTGKEHIKSIEFLFKLKKKFKLNIICLEPEIQGNRKGTKYKKINLIHIHKLDLNGRNFEKGIKKYGIPSVANKWCTRDLKNIPIKKYADDYFGKNNYSIALGIRADEIDRISKNYKENNIFYPLADHKITTKERNKFWSEQSFKIEIPAYKGNCLFCFEKSNRKNLTHYLEEPKEINWWSKMQKKYSKNKIKNKKQYNSMIDKYGGAYPFRGNIPIEELVKMATIPFKKATDEYIYENDLFDLEGKCGQSCIVFE